MNILQLAACAIAAALCALLLRNWAPGIAVTVTLAAGVLLLGQALTAVSGIRGLMDSLAHTAGVSPEVWKPVIKTVGIGITARLASAVCRDAGEGGIAAFLETAGTALALFTALPLLELVFHTLEELL